MDCIFYRSVYHFSHSRVGDVWQKKIGKVDQDLKVLAHGFFVHAVYLGVIVYSFYELWRIPFFFVDKTTGNLHMRDRIPRNPFGDRSSSRKEIGIGDVASFLYRSSLFGRHRI